MSAYPRTFATQANRPGGGPGTSETFQQVNKKYSTNFFAEVYSWNDNMDILADLSTSKLASIARWQPELVFPVQLSNPDKHILAVVFFTPKELPQNVSNELKISVDGDRKLKTLIEN